MDFSLVRAHGDVKQLGHLLPVTTLAHFGAVCHAFKLLARGFYSEDIYLCEEDERPGYVFAEYDDTDASYAPDALFHDTPMTCVRLEVDVRCRIPPAAIRCSQLVLRCFGPEFLPLIHKRLTTLRIDCDPVTDFFVSLADVLQLVGASLEWLQIAPLAFPDGHDFARLVTEFQASFEQSALERLAVTTPSVDVMVEVLERNIDFFCHSVLRLIFVTLKPYRPLLPEEIERIKSTIAGKFVFVPEPAPGAKARLLVFYGDRDWLHFNLLPVSNPLLPPTHLTVEPEEVSPPAVPTPDPADVNAGGKRECLTPMFDPGNVYPGATEEEVSCCQYHAFIYPVVGDMALDSPLIVMYFGYIAFSVFLIVAFAF